MNDFISMCTKIQMHMKIHKNLKYCFNIIIEQRYIIILFDISLMPLIIIVVVVYYYWNDNDLLQSAVKR